MQGLFRRRSVWYARLVVPHAVRAFVGKTEFISSTGAREPTAARVVASELLAGWRRQLHDLMRIAAPRMDVELIQAGHPALAGGGYLTLSEAARVSGIEEPYLLEQATRGALNLFFRTSGTWGHLCGPEAFEYEFDDEGEKTLIVPSPAQMAQLGTRENFVGVLGFTDATRCASRIAGGVDQESILLTVPGQHNRFFRPDQTVVVRRQNLSVLAREVESLRSTLATAITPAQLDLARTSKREASKPDDTKSNRHVSEAAAAYMKVRELNCSAEQARRVRAALDLFVELEADPRLHEIDHDRMVAFRDERLPMVPGHENKIRLQHHTTSVSESIQAISGTSWARISPGEQVKRLHWIAGMFEWLKQRDWIESDPCLALVKESRAAATVKKRRARDQDRRDLFTRDELKSIFSAGSWFQSGRGEITASGTFREFMPLYYWLPLLGLFTGGRINELSQLFLRDIHRTEGGVWCYDIAVLDDEGGKKRRKNANARRRVPVHPLLLSLGFVEWRNRLIAAGYQRLFPELKHDDTKGYGKAATKWFSSYLKRLGWERNGRKVFHSFRATLATECVNRLKLSMTETAQISGHARGSGSVLETYVKDEVPDVLVNAVQRLDFDLPAIAAFDCDSGLKAVKDALGRKDGGRGSIED